MKFLTARTMRNIAKALVASFVSVLIFSINTSPANAFAGTLENGNLAYAQSTFNKGEACNYLPGFEKGYDAWHWILTTRGATFQQDPRNPAVAINLNIVYMRQDGSLFTIKSGAWVQTGKGAYTYTPVADRIRLVQAGSLALINGSDSGMRLSHTCPGSGSITATPSASPTPSVSPTATSTPSPTTSPTATPTATPTPTATTTSSPRPTTSPSPTVSATPTPTGSPSPSLSPSPTPTASPSPSLSPSPTPTPKPSSTVTPTLAPRPSARASAIQIRPTSKPNALPTPSPSPQGITETPSPSPTATPTKSATPTPTPTQSTTPEPTPTPTQEPTPTPPALIPPVLPIPPTVEEPKKLIFVEPKTPTVVPPQTLPEPPASPVVITKQPEYGQATVTPAGEITYTSTLTDPKSTTVDVVEITYTSLSGAVVVVRKEFILAQRGDVPSIIQTGYGASNNKTFGFALVLIAVATTFVIRRRGRNNEA